MQQRSKHRFANLPQGGENPLQYAVTQRDKSTISMVRDAVEHKQTLMAYQPVIRDMSSKSIAFYEGLIRVLDPTGRVIPARDFMPVVETTQLGREIDVLSLRAGMMALQHNPNLRVSINMSARSIGFKAWTNMMQRWLSRDPTLGERLILEISEQSAMLMPELVADFINRMQDQGVCFALDNFGSGYTAIRYFKELYFDILKIDGQFTRGISKNPENRALITVMVSIAENFDMVTVAEQVENEEDCEVLRQLGVDCQQGYLFGGPTTRPYWAINPDKQKSG
ncbi:EAL domain, c-di-GMP-specific phosphodiesterase class I (or its enzymatically inactive variant) [Sulfitobacter marinus]|uniref:EAL domain, c-di-GMP-specific phosphodiesterase class I (Or its enzymatically inactive variant) n=1 Tax=Sulfitobacter marinus TaxID=394264 RepID=A0A1I6RIE2_9RHOB|nr:EAL domain-containing protein [Sulfitobacter marinus]SFS64533.1 EAL domain, c-di-GMP-specific phosphodiesterase class I (or its enzymatically inactive variant) [Sulfitobacter marinus]